MQKGNKDLEQSFAGTTDHGPALGDYSALENSRQNFTLFSVVRGRWKQRLSFRLLAEQTVTIAIEVWGDVVKISSKVSKP